MSILHAPLRVRALAALRLGTAALFALQALVATAAPAPRGRLEPAFGVTPGGLVWTVEPVARRLVLRDPEGSERAVFPLGDEGHVLGVADSGARVTAPTPDGFRRGLARSGEERQVEARYVFRFPDGSVRATGATTALRGSEPAFFGDEVWLLRRGGGRWSVVRVAPDGETPFGTVSEAAVKERVGRPSGPRLFAGASGVAVLFPGTRGDAAVRLDRPDVLYLPDPLEACGEGRARLVLPHAEGVLRVSVRTAPWQDEGDQGEPLAVAEVVDDAGRLLRSVALGPWNEVFPLPDGGLLGLDGRESARFDDRFSEISRTVMPLEEGSDPAAAARVVEQLRRLERLGPRATGADWAELALLPGAPASRYLDRAIEDPNGALERLGRVADGEPAALEAAKALPLLLGVLRPDAREAVVKKLRERVESGSPAWLRRVAARALLAASPADAPAWALPAVAEAIASGADGGDVSLPDEAFTLELAELVTAVDRARIDRIVQETARGRRRAPRRKPGGGPLRLLRRAAVPRAGQPLRPDAPRLHGRPPVRHGAPRPGAHLRGGPGGFAVPGRAGARRRGVESERSKRAAVWRRLSSPRRARPTRGFGLPPSPSARSSAFPSTRPCSAPTS